MNTWTKPFYGVSHFGEFSTQKRWATIEQWETFTKLLKWVPGCGFNPTEEIHDTPEQAKRSGEKFVNARP